MRDLATNGVPSSELFRRTTQVMNVSVMRQTPMLRWTALCAGFGVPAALLAKALLRWLQLEPGGNAHLGIWAVLYPGAYPLMLWLPTWILGEHPVAALLIAILLNCVAFGALGAVAYKANAWPTAQRLALVLICWWVLAGFLFAYPSLLQWLPIS